MEAPAAVGAEHLTLENIGGISAFVNRPAFLADLFPVFLHRNKEFVADNRLMGVSGNNQVVVIRLDLPVIHHLCLALHQIAGINLAFQNLHYCAGLPFAAPNQTGAGDFAGRFFVVAWRRNSHFIEITDNAVQRYALISPFKNLFHNRGRILVDQQLVTVIRVFPVAIGCPCADIIAVFHGLSCLRLDLPAYIQGIGFIYHIFQGEHNAAVKVAGVRCVKLIRDRNKTDIVRVKILLNIIAGINGITPQAG